MKAYEGTFLKADGSKRKMRFCKITEMPQIFLESKIKNSGSARKLPTGRELVWDLDKASFRVFNHTSVIGTLNTIELDEKELV